MVLSGWLVPVATVAIAALLVVVPRAAGRARGVREGWVCGPMTFRERAALYGPAAVARRRRYCVPAGRAGAG